ncbi:hypothetical protein GCM10027446_27050 [Angustibacter peucedani]
MFRVTRRLPFGASLAGAAVVATLVGGVLVPAPAQAATSTPSRASAESDFAGRINASRSAADHAALVRSTGLNTVARAWAAHLASTGRLEHNPKVWSQVKGWRYLAENVGVGSDVASLHSAFMHSSGHKANILGTRYTRVGVGVAYGHGRTWVVEVFERPLVSRTWTPPTISYGQKGPAVRNAQVKLRVKATGYFNRTTWHSVRSYQWQHRMKVTGRLDPPTRKRLHV